MSQIPTPTEQQLQKLVAARIKIDPEEVPLDQPLLEDLGLDSFDLMTVILEIEEQFSPVALSDKSAADLKTLSDVAMYIDQIRANQK